MRTQFGITGLLLIGLNSIYALDVTSPVEIDGDVNSSEVPTIKTANSLISKVISAVYRIADYQLSKHYDSLHHTHFGHNREFANNNQEVSCSPYDITTPEIPGPDQNNTTFHWNATYNTDPNTSCVSLSEKFPDLQHGGSQYKNIHGTGEAKPLHIDNLSGCSDQYDGPCVISNTYIPTETVQYNKYHTSCDGDYWVTTGFRENDVALVAFSNDKYSSNTKAGSIDTATLTGKPEITNPLESSTDQGVLCLPEYERPPPGGYPANEPIKVTKTPKDTPLCNKLPEDTNHCMSYTEQSRPECKEYSKQIYDIVSKEPGFDDALYMYACTSHTQLPTWMLTDIEYTIPKLLNKYSGKC